MLEKIISRFLYFPDRIPLGMPPPPWAREASEVWIQTPDGVRIHGLWWEGTSGRPAILFLHGNAQEVYSWSLVREELALPGYPMLLIDYRGYGKSEGKPSEEGLYLDGRAALDWLRDRGYDEENVVIFGKSLGGAVACEIARGLNLKGLVLESTFSSLASAAGNLFPFPHRSSVPDGAYNSLSKLKQIRCPVLIIHGDSDNLIPVSEGLELSRRANQPKSLYIVEGAGHNDVSLVAGEEYGNRIRKWLDTPENPDALSHK